MANLATSLRAHHRRARFNDCVYSEEETFADSVPISALLLKHTENTKYAHGNFIGRLADYDYLRELFLC